MFSVGFGGSCFQKDILNLVYIRFHNSSNPYEVIQLVCNLILCNAEILSSFSSNMF